MNTIENQIEAIVLKLIQPDRDAFSALEKEVRGNHHPATPQQAQWSPKDVCERFGIRDTQTVRGWCCNADGVKGLYLNGKKSEFSGHWEIPLSEVTYLDSTNGKPRRHSA